MAHKIIKIIKDIDRKLGIPNWLCYLLAAVFIFRIPSLLEPYSYGDEMIYLTLGNAIRHGLTLYSQIHDNKPPLLYIMAGIAGNLFWFKAILTFWILGTIVFFHHLTKLLFDKNKLGPKVACIVFAILTTIPLLEGNIVNAELFLIGPIIFGLFLLLRPTKSWIHILIAGLAFGIAILFKVPAIFDAPVVILFWLITSQNTKELPEIIKKTIIFSLGIIAPIALTFLWYLSKGALNDYVKAAFLQNIGYISSWSGSQNTSFVTKNGPLLIKAGVIIVGLILLRIKSSKLSKVFLISTIWLFTSLFAATLSGRPYPHYLVQVVPALSILIGILLSSQKFEQVLAIFPLTLAIFVPVYYHFWYYPTAPYYIRFVQLVTNQISKETYFNKFNGRTTGNYETAKKIQNLVTPDERIFVWGEDAPVIYALSRRLPSIKYTANYHITDYSSLKDTLDSFTKNPPVLIIILTNSSEFKGLPDFLQTKYIKISSDENSQIWHLFSPKGV